MDRIIWIILSTWMWCFQIGVLVLIGLAANPPLVGAGDLEVPVKEMSDSLREDCRTYSRGLYTARLPLIPVYIEVLECDGADALTRTHYFPLGTVEMEVGLHGPNITKPLN